MFHSRLLCLGIIITTSASGCVQYKEKPLHSKQLFKQVEIKRRSTESLKKKEFSFVKAAMLMTANNPELKKIKAEYDKVQSVAQLKIPWPNPSIEIGPDIGKNLGSGVGNKIQPFIALGFTIPLGSKRKIQGDLNTIHAELAYINVQAQHRLLYLKLRETYSHLALTHLKKTIHQSLIKSSNEYVETMESLLDISSVTALDLGMVKYNEKKTKLELLEIQSEGNEVKAELSKLLGLDVTTFMPDNKMLLPKLEKGRENFTTLKKVLLENNISLAKLRVKYRFAEKKLQYEISKQYPDIQFGVERERELGSKKSLFGLRLGIELPIFSKNKKGIIEAEKQREIIRQAYISEVHNRLSNLKKVFDNIALYQKKVAILNREVKQLAHSNLKMARQALNNGAIDALKYSEVFRAHQQTRKDLVYAEIDLREAWIELEQTLAYPIQKFAGEKDYIFTYGKRDLKSDEEKKNAK